MIAARATLLPPAPTHAEPRPHAGDPLALAVQAAHRVAEALSSLALNRRRAIVMLAHEGFRGGVDVSPSRVEAVYSLRDLARVLPKCDVLPFDASAWALIVERGLEGPADDERIAWKASTWACERQPRTIPAPAPEESC